MKIHLSLAPRTAEQAGILALACSAALAVAMQGSAALPPTVVCSQATYSFSGTAYDLIVPADGGCDITAATITHDLVVGANAGADVQRTTIGHDLTAGRASFVQPETTSIGHDLVATQPQSVQTGHNGPTTPGGPVKVGHDVLVAGAPAAVDELFDGYCNLTVGHDFRITDRLVLDGFGVGDSCASRGQPAVTTGHDLVVSGNSAGLDFFGNPAGLEIGGNSVLPGGVIEVSDNVVGHDAVCAANRPGLVREPGDGPNTAGHANSCG